MAGLPSPSALARALRPVVVAALVAPYVALAIILHAVRKGRAARRLLALARLVKSSHLLCPRGHWSALHGVWECRGCGGLFVGYAFGWCPTCGSSGGYVECEHCGLAVRNPFL